MHPGRDPREAVRHAIARAVDRADLSESEAEAAAAAIVDGAATPCQIAALLVALHAKGETPDEIVGFARALRARAVRVVAPPGAIDACGTGGDGHGTLNVSTVAALVAAAAGCVVAKHGNRAVSGRCGSADLLEELGVDATPDARRAARSLRRHGIAFLHAPRFHRAARRAAVPRREIGVRSIFNLVGPLTNPAGVRRQVVGVADPALVQPFAAMLERLGADRALVVGGLDGLDEISVCAPTRVAALEAGRVRAFDLDARELGFPRRELAALRGGLPPTNARIALEVLGGAAGAPRDVVLANAAAAIVVAGRAPDLGEGVAQARDALDSGRAAALLEALRADREAVVA